MTVLYRLHWKFQQPNWGIDFMHKVMLSLALLARPPRIHRAMPQIVEACDQSVEYAISHLVAMYLPICAG